MSRLQRILACGLLVLLAVLLAGCWDRREIQERNLVLAVAIDLAEEGKKPGQSPTVVKTETFYQPQDTKRYRLSMQILKLQAKGGKNGGGSGSSERTFVLSNTGDSMFEMVRDMLGQSSRSLFFEHINAIIISEAVLRQTKLEAILDFFRRDAEMRWRIRVYATPGEARKIIEYQPKTGEPGGLFLAAIPRNHYKDPHLAVARTDLGYIVQTMDNKGDVILPRIELAGGVMKITGLALFKRDQFVTYMDDYAVKGLRMIRATEKSAIITAEYPEHPGDLLAFELKIHNTRLTPHVEGEQIYFTLDIAMTGDLGELNNTRYSPMNSEVKRRMEVLLAEEVKRNVLYTKDFCQQAGVDPMNFAYKLKAHEPKTWERVKEQWAEIFPAIPLIVSVNVHIRDVGGHQ
jgi:Ger(x)C family germination protein